MPREFRMLTAAPVELEAIARAAAVVDPGLGVRATANGQVLQLVAADDETILSVGASRRVDVGDDVARIAPSLAGEPALAGSAWWSEAFAPWTPGGERGGRIVAELVRATGGMLERSDA
jgi:hypothetical protein